MRTAALLLLLSGCAHLDVDMQAPHVECHALKGCPTDAQLQTLLDVSSRYLPGFDPSAPLTVEWHAFGERYEVGGSWIDSYVRGPRWVVVDSVGELGHELRHLHLLRISGDADVDHSDAGWAADEALKAEMRAAQGAP